MVRESFFDHLHYEKRYSTLTIDAYRCDLIQFEDYLRKVYDIDDDTKVSHVMIRSWLASMIESGISPRSVNRKLSTLKTYFKYLLKLDIIETSPVRFSSSLKFPERLPSFATKKEMEIALLPHVQESFSNSRDIMVLETFYNTGIRLAELENLMVNDIDTYTKTIKVTGKRNKQRIIPVGDIFLERINHYLQLRDRIAQEGVKEFIINDKGEKATRSFIGKLVKEYLTLAGVTGARSPHVLRHTFATLMLNEGADLNAIKELLGHSSLASTQVYTHTNVEKLKTIYKQAHPWAKKKEES